MVEEEALWNACYDADGRLCKLEGAMGSTQDAIHQLFERTAYIDYLNRLVFELAERVKGLEARARMLEMRASDANHQNTRCPGCLRLGAAAPPCNGSGSTDSPKSPIEGLFYHRRPKKRTVIEPS